MMEQVIYARELWIRFEVVDGWVTLPVPLLNGRCLEGEIPGVTLRMPGQTDVAGCGRLSRHDQAICLIGRNEGGYPIYSTCDGAMARLIAESPAGYFPVITATPGAVQAAGVTATPVAYQSPSQSTGMPSEHVKFSSASTEAQRVVDVLPTASGMFGPSSLQWTLMVVIGAALLLGMWAMLYGLPSLPRRRQIMASLRQQYAADLNGIDFRRMK